MPTWDELYADPTLVPVPDEPEPFVTRALEAMPAPRSTPVLDIGCGGGRHLLWLERHGFPAFATSLPTGWPSRATGCCARCGRSAWPGPTCAPCRSRPRASAP